MMLNLINFKTVDRFQFPNSHLLHAYRLQDITKNDAIPDGVEDDVYVLSIRVALATQYLRRRHQIDLLELYDYCGPGWHLLACPEHFDLKIAVRLHSTIELIAKRVREPLTPPRALHFHQERDQLRLADALLCPGEIFFNEEVCAVYPFLNKSLAYLSKPVLHSSIATRRASDARDILFYGRLSTLKGLDTFLRAIPKAMTDPQFANWIGRFFIVGPEETVASGLTKEEMLQAVPEALHSRLVFKGASHMTSLPNYCRTSASRCLLIR